MIEVDYKFLVLELLKDCLIYKKQMIRIKLDFIDAMLSILSNVKFSLEAKLFKGDDET